MLASFCKTGRVFIVAKISSRCFFFTCNSSLIFLIFESFCNEIQICIVSCKYFPQCTIVSKMSFNVAFKSFYLCSRTSGGVAGCNLICSSDICTPYSNFIFASVFFDSLIARASFVTFYVGGSTSPTFTSETLLQLSSMDFSNCSCR